MTILMQHRRPARPAKDLKHLGKGTAVRPDPKAIERWEDDGGTEPPRPAAGTRPSTPTTPIRESR